MNFTIGYGGQQSRSSTQNKGNSENLKYLSNNVTFKPQILHQHFNLAVRQQWNFPSHVGTLYLHLRVTSVSTLVSCGQFKPAQTSLV